MDSNLIVEWAQGNFGALNFLTNLAASKDVETINNIVSKLSKAKSIRGTNLYVLYSDLCDKNMAKVERLCLSCPIEILEDACSRQDYSGIYIVIEYLK